MLISPTCLCNFFSTNRETGFPFKGTPLRHMTLWGTLCVISLEAHVKSIQGEIGMSERVTS